MIALGQNIVSVHQSLAVVKVAMPPKQMAPVVHTHHADGDNDPTTNIQKAQHPWLTLTPNSMMAKPRTYDNARSTGLSQMLKRLLSRG